MHQDFIFLNTHQGVVFLGTH